MVEYINQLDNVFASLSDPTRRDILMRVSAQEMSISEIAGNYQLSFAAVAKHIHVLERARLIRKRRRGKEQIVTMTPETLAMVDEYLRNYRKLWETRLDSLDTYLHSINQGGNE